MKERENVLRPLRGRDYTGPETRSYPEPTEAEQAENLRKLQENAATRRRIRS